MGCFRPGAGCESSLGVAVKTSICFRTKTWRGLRCSSSSSRANSSREESCGLVVFEESVAQVVVGLEEEHVDIVRGFLAGLVLVVTDGADSGEALIALSAEVTDTDLGEGKLILLVLGGD
mmetsp:Transcript_9109/g.18915  ORF Transcript_9109/g.18915 Transcript_9109/m.18915 type:complete len:120 (-) Transcript_9109:83-442(-)